MKMEHEKPLLGAIIGRGIIRGPTSGAFLLLILATIAFFSLPFTTKTFSSPPWPLLDQPEKPETRVDPNNCSGFFRNGPPRKFVMSITEFGGVGDGETSNTDAFRKAVEYLKRFQDKGGSQLNVPKGRWVTGSFNLTNSSSDVCVEDCYIESGDDLVSVKSGWDQYGIAMAQPSSNIIVRRISGTTPTCSGVGIGSEMSGGVYNITIEDIHVWDSAAGVRIKTDVGRGGYIANISISNLRLERVKVPIKFSRGANDHPDDRWDPKAFPRVWRVFISDVVSENSQKAPEILGIEGSPCEGICLRNVTILGLSSSKTTWHCEHVSGSTSNVYPPPCPELGVNSSVSSASCGFS